MGNNAKKKLGINAILNVIKQSLSVLFPLITYPYAMRVLGPTSLGKVNYSQSIVSYFSLIAMLGIVNYSVREGAKRKKNKEEFAVFANEIFTINILTTLLSYVLLVALLLFIPKFKDYTLLILLQSITIILGTLGIDWVNVIFEDYLFITIRSIVTHVVSLLLLFVFVHNEQDYYLYALLTVITSGIICISNWFYCRKYVKLSIVKVKDMKLHLIPMLVLFANSVAVTIYINFDVTMLGWIKGDYDVGLYGVSVKVYSIVKNLLAAIYVVAIPRLSSFVGSDDFDSYKKVYSGLWSYLSVLLIPCAVGLLCVSQEIMYIMGGEEYLDSTLSLQILCFALIFAVFGGLVTGCINIVNGYELNNLKATIISALLNIGLNFIFIPLFSLNGAAFTTMISELFVFVFCLINVKDKKKFFDKKAILLTLSQAIIGSLCIAIYSFTVKYFISNLLIRFAVIVIGSVVIYFIILLLMKNKILIEMLDKILKRKKNV